MIMPERVNRDETLGLTGLVFVIQGCDDEFFGVAVYRGMDILLCENAGMDICLG